MSYEISEYNLSGEDPLVVDSVGVQGVAAAIGGTIGGGGLESTTGFTPQRGLLTDSSGTVVTNDRFRVIADETSADVYATNFFGNLNGNISIPGLRTRGVVYINFS